MAEAALKKAKPKPVAVKVFANNKEVRENPQIAELFDKRIPDEMGILMHQIKEYGQQGKALLLEKADHYLIIDGHDTVRAVGLLQQDGDAVELAWEAYQPEAATPDGVFAEIMGVAIRRKMIQTTQDITEDDKKGAILTYLKVCATQGINRTASWDAEILGCSATWVRKVREQAVTNGQLQAVASLQTKDGQYRRAKNFHSPIDLSAGLEATAEAEPGDEDIEPNIVQFPGGPAPAATEDEGATEEDTHEANGQEEGIRGTQGIVQEHEEPDPGEHPKEETVGWLGEPFDLVKTWNERQPKPFQTDHLMALTSMKILSVKDKQVEKAPSSMVEAKLVDFTTAALLLFSDKKAAIEAAIRWAIHPFLEEQPKPKSRAKKK